MKNIDPWVQDFGQNWLHTVLLQSNKRQKKRQTEKQKKKVEDVKQKNKEEKNKQYNFEEDPFWSSEIFGKFGSAPSDQDWFGSHKNPLTSF